MPRHNVYNVHFKTAIPLSECWLEGILTMEAATEMAAVTQAQRQFSSWELEVTRVTTGYNRQPALDPTPSPDEAMPPNSCVTREDIVALREDIVALGQRIDNLDTKIVATGNRVTRLATKLRTVADVFSGNL